MLTVMLILVIGAFICTIMSAAGKCPLWVPVILLCIAVALIGQVIPIK